MLLQLLEVLHLTISDMKHFFICLLAKEGSSNRSDSLQGKVYDIERKHPGFGLRGTRAEEQKHFVSSTTLTVLAVKREKSESFEKM